MGSPLRFDGDTGEAVWRRDGFRTRRFLAYLPWPAVVLVVVLVTSWLVDPSRVEPAALPSSDGAEHDPEALDVPRFVESPPVPRDWIPVLRMPFPAGTVVQCAQGNYAEPGRTHALPQNLHALDFANRSDPEVVVVAAAEGEVAYVVRDAGGDPRAGGGYGNQVRVVHGHSVFTLYSHLDTVEVRVGDRVAVGQRLGTMGRTGLAGDRHLHFSLHHGVISSQGVPSTMEMPALVTREFDAGSSPSFAEWSSGELRCSPTGKPWSGAFYGSENDAGRPRLGAVSDALEQQLIGAQARLERAATRRARLWWYSTHVPRTTPAAARRFLGPLLAEDDSDPVTHYAWAVEVEMQGRNWRAALLHLDRAWHLLHQPRLFEPWLPPWIENQRGAIALARGQPYLAREHFDRAQAFDPSPDVAGFAARKWQDFR